jgi:hypothetical protein
VQENETLKDDKKTIKQVPIYFISEALAGSKRYYSEMDKICYMIVMSARNLRHYFEEHIEQVLTNQPLNDIFDNLDITLQNQIKICSMIVVHKRNRQMCKQHC